MLKASYLLLIYLISSASFGQQETSSFYDQLAEHWAPIHYQSIRKIDGLFNRNSLKGKSDSLSSFNFDGDWNATNNWNNLSTYDIEPVIYYYVSSTSTHHFITYGFFHARDWTQVSFFNIAQHENDLEGILLVIERDETTWGKLILGYSVFHLNLKRYFYPSFNKKKLLSNRFKPGEITEENHPISYQQPKGHGVKLDNSFFKTNRPYCRYTPAGLIRKTNQDEQYNLINLSSNGQLIEQQNNNSFFKHNGTIKGSHGEGAKPPWLWTDFKDSKSNPDLYLFIDPAKYVLIDCDFIPSFSTDYTYHPFLDSTNK